MDTTTRGRSHLSIAARWWMLLIITLILLLTFTAGAAQAQSSWTLIGFVRDEVGQPIEGAEILIGGMETRAVTDVDGRFRIPGVSLGLTYIGARRIGYLPVVDLVRFSPTDTLEFILDRLGQRMDTVKVRARAEAAWERDMRRYAWVTDAARTGSVLTERDIASRSPIYTSDLFRAKAGFNVVGDGANARVVGSRSRCSPTVFLDGQPVPGFNVNDIMPSTIRLMVTYPGLAGLPIELQSMRGNPNCGTIAIISR